MNPTFPKFKKLGLEDKNSIQQFTFKHPAYSDYNFASLWSYNVEEDIKYSFLNNNLVVRFRDYISNEYFYSFIGNNHVNDTIDQLLKLSKSEGLKLQLKLIPEIVLEKELIINKFNISEDPDNFDYILLKSDHAELKTSKFYKHRRLISSFYKNNPNYQVEELDLNNEKNRVSVLNLFTLWASKKNKTPTEINNELIACKRAIKDAHYLNLSSLGIYNNSQLLGLVIYDADHNYYVESHFLKFDPSYNGMSHVIHHLLSKHLNNKKQKFINIEQDLGLKGLRISKQFARPHHILKKYIISLN